MIAPGDLAPLPPPDKPPVQANIHSVCECFHSAESLAGGRNTKGTDSTGQLFFCVYAYIIYNLIYIYTWVHMSISSRDPEADAHIKEETGASPI